MARHLLDPEDEAAAAMMPNLIRKQLLDRVWDAADLDAAAEFWLRLYESAARLQGFTATPAHAIEIRLRGFPRLDSGELCRELCRRVATSDIPAPEVELHDPDTLVLTSGEIPGSESPPVGLGLPLLDGPPFDGLMAEVRVQAIGREGHIVRRGKVESTLVMVGELRGGRLHLKALWRTGSSGWEDDLHWVAPWGEQEGWLAALDQFRAEEVIPDKLAKKLFLSRGVDRIGSWIVKLIHVPIGKPRLAALIKRLAIFTALLVPIALGAYWSIENEHWFLLLLLILWFWWVVWLGWILARGEARMWFQGFAEFRERYKQMYDEAVKVVPLSESEAAARLDLPWARKYTAELEAAGFLHFGDLRCEPEVSGTGVFRIFLAPDGATYLNVMFSTSTHPDPELNWFLWPGVLVFIAQTFFPDGGRVSSINGRTAGFRGKRTGPEQLVRVFPDAEEPLDFTRRHLAAVEEYAKENGRIPIRHERFDLYVRRQNEAQEEERLLYGEDPYTWGDHWHWYIQQPRRVYRG